MTRHPRSTSNKKTKPNTKPSQPASTSKGILSNIPTNNKTQLPRKRPPLRRHNYPLHSLGMCFLTPSPKYLQPKYSCDSSAGYSIQISTKLYLQHWSTHYGNGPAWCTTHISIPSQTPQHHTDLSTSIKQRRDPTCQSKFPQTACTHQTLLRKQTRFHPQDHVCLDLN